MALKSFDGFGLNPVLERMKIRKIKEIPFTIKGPYKWVRHPMYFFVLFLIWVFSFYTLD